ncbi:MAG: lipopolysaccharide biosynthesis protein [Paracoccaceae bacterium]
MHPLFPRADEIAGFALQAAYLGAAFALAVLLTRTLGAEEFGRFALVQAWLLMAAGGISSGMVALLVREIASDRAEGRAAEARGLAVFAVRTTAAASLGLAAIGVGIAALGPEELRLTGLIAALALPFLVQTSVSGGIARGLGAVVPGLAPDMVLRPVFHLAAVASLVAAGLTATAALAITGFVLAAALACLAGEAVRRRAMASALPTIAPAQAAGRWWSSLRALYPGGWIDAATLQLGVILVGLLGGPEDAGGLRVATQLAMLGTFGMTVMVNLQGPALAAAAARHDRARMQALARRAARLSLAVAGPLALLAIFAGGPVLGLLFGAEFAEFAQALAVLALGQCCRAATGTVAQTLLAVRAEAAMTRTMAAALCLYAVLGMLLVPVAGALGAALAWTLATAVERGGLVWLAWGRAGILCLPAGRAARHPS